MRKLFAKTARSIRDNGPFRTLIKIVRYPYKRLQDRRYENLIRNENRSKIFTIIYKRNTWGNFESFSGDGSSFLYTENLRRHLPELFKAFAIKTVYDAPCGDFNWMKEVVSKTGINYIGADIVAPLIERLKKNDARNVRFCVSDITVDDFPSADLWFCRDCLFHLSNKDIFRALGKFLSADIPYLLTTTHINESQFINCDTFSGGYRVIDLFAPPFNFPRDVKSRIDDWVEPFPPREMCLWTRDQVARAVSSAHGLLPV
jgi:hypothetical protein